MEIGGWDKVIECDKPIALKKDLIKKFFKEQWPQGTVEECSDDQEHLFFYETPEIEATVNELGVIPETEYGFIYIIVEENEVTVVHEFPVHQKLVEGIEELLARPTD